MKYPNVFNLALTTSLTGVMALSSCSLQNLGKSPVQTSKFADTSSAEKPAADVTPSGTPSSDPSGVPTSSPSPVTATSVVHTPFQLELTQSDLDSIFLNGVVLPSLSGTLSEPIPDFTVTNPINVKISGLNLTFNYNFNQPTFNAATDIWQLSANSLSADLMINRIDATQTVQVTQGGTQITVTLDGYCDQVHLILPNGATTATGAVQVDFAKGAPHFTLTSLNSSWTPGSWQVASMDCHGPNGFDKVVANAAESELRQINPFLDQIKKVIQTNLDEVAGNNISLSLGISPNISLTLNAEKFTTLGGVQNFIKIEGNSDFNFTNVPQGLGCGTSLAAFPAPPNSTMAEDSITFPTGVFSALISCLYLNKSLQSHFNSTQIPSFNSLEGNWFEEIFVWPDLLHFSHSDVFDFEISSEISPSFQNLRGGAANQVIADLNVPLTIDVNAPEHGVSVPYIHFFPTISGATAVSIASGKVTLTLQKGSKLNLDKVWDPSYLEKYDPNTFIWTGLITSGMKGFLKNPGLSFQLPELAISPQLGMIFEDVNLEQDNIRFGVSFSNPSAKTTPAATH